MNKAAWFIIFISAAMLTASTHASPISAWTEHPGNPVLTPGPSGSWDDGNVVSVEVVHAGELYRMWYTGNQTQTLKLQIGYATSTDGISWVKYGSNPVLTPGAGGSWDEMQVSAPTVMLDGSIWKMWYAGKSDTGKFQIGYATSPDGINWTKYGNNPVLSVGSAGNWDDSGVFSPHAVLKDGIYHMWYGGRNVSHIQIGYATSTDGIAWVKHNSNPVLTIGSSSAWDSQDVVSPSVVFRNGKYHMWYQGTGLLSETTQASLTHVMSLDASSFSASTRNGFGYATSLDGISWIKDSANPILTPGPLGSWDANSIYYPSVIYHDGFLRMWFHGNSAPDAPLKVGYAETPATEYKVALPIVIK